MQINNNNENAQTEQLNNDINNNINAQTEQMNNDINNNINAQTEQLNNDINNFVNEQPKRKRGRPRKQQEKPKTDKDLFLDDLVEHRFVDYISGNSDITYPSDDDEPKIQLPPIKDTLIFLDGIICYSLKRFLKKDIEPMSEEDAEFIASLAPSDLQLLKPSKETFFYTLAAYYLLKLF
jgi:hypothetical protein